MTAINRLSLLASFLLLVAMPAAGETFSGSSTFDGGSSFSGDPSHIGSSFGPPESSSDLYDLTAHEAFMVDLYDDNGSARPAFANPPVGLGSPTVISTDDCATLQGLDGGTNEHVQITAAITGCTLTLDGTDVYIEMTGAGSITSTGNHFITGTRVKMTGGTLDSTASAGGTQFNGTDVTIDNVVMDIYSMYFPIAAAATRVTIMNSTIDTDGWGVLIENDNTIGTSQNSDIIFANLDLDGSNSGSSSVGGIRAQDTDRFLLVDSLVHSNSAGANYRGHADLNYAGATGNVFESGTGESSNWYLFWTRVNQEGDMNGIYMKGNDFVATDAATTRPGGAADFTAPSDCDDVQISGNNVYTGTSDSFFVYDESNTFCTNLTAGSANNTMIDYTGSAYDPMLDCGDLGCGADH